MVIIPEAVVRHKGLMVDNTTKLEVQIPELLPEDDMKLIQYSKIKSASIIVVDTTMLDAVVDLIKQVKDIQTIPEQEEEEEIEEIPGEPWEENSETGFESR